VATVAEGKGELYAWTVDDTATATELAQLGVTGIISNDPRIFTAAVAGAPALAPAAASEAPATARPSTAPAGSQS
jgi:hypothetical protein